MEMYDVLNKLKAIENPSEDEQAAIKSAEAMNNPTNPAAKPAEETVEATDNPMMPETQEVSATGEEVYQPVAQETPTEYARLAGVQTLNVQTDAPETTNESVEVKEKPLTEAEWFVKATDLVTYEMDVEANSEQEAEEKAYDILQSEDKEDYSAGGEGAIVQSVQMYEGVEETIEEAKPDFLDLDKDGDKEESMKKAAKDKEDMKEEDTTPEQYEKNEKVTEEDVETIELDESYDPAHVKGIVDKHEKEGHKVQMDRPEDGAQGFTVTFKDGKKRHYKYHQGGVKVQSLEPEDPMVDPDAPKRERGRPKKESEELNLDSMMEEFEKKYTEQLNEGMTITQSIDDQGNENVNLNANGDHVDMVKDLLKLSGMRSDGYKEYKGEEEPVEEERDPQWASTPNEKVADVDTQLNKMSGGLNGPKDKSAAKSNSNPLHTMESKDAEDMMQLYKEYKDSE